MAITNTKTWEYVVNLVVSEVDIATRNRQLTLQLKRALTDTGGVQAVDEAGANISLTSPWAIVASSNGVVANTSDNWSALADIVYAAAGNAHAWIHLRQVDYFGAGDHLHMLLDCIPSISGNPVARMSFTRGATGYNNNGTTTNRPTHAEATSEIITRDGAATIGDEVTSDMMWGSDASNAQAILHVRISDDGLCGAVFVAVGGLIQAWHGWQAHEEPDPDVDHQFEVWSLSNDSAQDVPDWSSALNTSAFMQSLANAGTLLASYVSNTFYNNSGTNVIASNNASTSRMLVPAYIVNTVTTSVRSVLTDMWWGNASDTTGDGSPAMPPVTRRQVGEMVIPWPSGVSMQVA